MPSHIVSGGPNTEAVQLNMFDSLVGLADAPFFKMLIFIQIKAIIITCGACGHSKPHTKAEIYNIHQEVHE